MSGQDFTAIVAGDCNGSWAAGGGGEVSVHHAQVRIGASRRVGRFIRIPLQIDGTPSAGALEADLRFDALRLRLRGVRHGRNARSAMLQSHQRQPGRLSLAMASIDGLPPGEAASLIFERLRPQGRRAAVKLVRGVLSW
jgi:hypothetical protein